MIGAPADSDQKGAGAVFEEGRSVATSKAKLEIEGVEPTSSAVLVRVAISAEGTVTVSGKGLTSE